MLILIRCLLKHNCSSLPISQLVSQPILWLIMPLDKIRQPLKCISDLELVQTPKDIVQYSTYMYVKQIQYIDLP